MSDANKPCLIGLEPWLPWPLSAWCWWTAPVPAEQLASLRIGIAAVLLWDIVQNYLPVAESLYSDVGMAPPQVLRSGGQASPWAWSLLGSGDVVAPGLVWPSLGASPEVVFWIMVIWAAAAIFLFLGLWTRAAAVLAWLISVEMQHLNPIASNGGDVVRVIVLFYLMLSPCGAAWSIDACRRRGRTGAVAYLVPPWPLRLLLVQMAVIYFFNGLHKLCAPEWRDGTVLYYVLNDLTLTRVSFVQLPVPLWLLRFAAWAVLAWELTFPLLVTLPSTRNAILAIGILFHLGLFVCMELGAFQLYMLTLYLPLLCPPRAAQPSSLRYRH
jgi:hypothetical protein